MSQRPGILLPVFRISFRLVGSSRLSQGHSQAWVRFRSLSLILASLEQRHTIYLPVLEVLQID